MSNHALTSMALMAATSVGCSMALWNSMSSPAWLTGKYFSSKKRTLLGNTVKLWCFIASRSAVIVPFVFMVWWCVMSWLFLCQVVFIVWCLIQISKKNCSIYESDWEVLRWALWFNLCRWCPQESCNNGSNLQHFTIPISLMVFTSPDIVLYVPT